MYKKKVIKKKIVNLQKIKQQKKKKENSELEKKKAVEENILKIVITRFVMRFQLILEVHEYRQRL